MSKINSYAAKSYIPILNANGKDIILIKGITQEEQLGYFYLLVNPAKKHLFEKEMDAIRAIDKEDSKHAVERKMFMEFFYGCNFTASKTVSMIDLSDYGEIVASGYGLEPSSQIKQYIQKTLGFSVF